jgi:hypothetical protein
MTDSPIHTSPRLDPRPDLRSLRRRWAGLPVDAPPALTIQLLASYTTDPLIPYAGVRLHDAGLSAKLVVGPYNQIMQQCLDDTSGAGRLRPDVLVVAPRFEELGAASYPELAACAEAAAQAARRWRSFLVFLLPEIPAERQYGVADSSRRNGTVAVTTTIRERVRDQLCGLNHVHLIDVEDAVRTLGTDRALRPALYAHARIPYSEEVFHLIGEQIAAVLRLRYSGGRQAVVIDADSITPDDGAPAALNSLAGSLSALLQAGLLLAVRSNQDADGMWARLGNGLAGIVGDPRVRWQVDKLPATEQLALLTAGFSALPGQVALLTADDAFAGLASSAGHPVCIVGDAPELWLHELTAAGLLDVLPGPGCAAGHAPAGAAAAPFTDTGSRPGEQSINLADFVAGLGVNVAFRELDPDLDDVTREVVDRAHDFTLGLPHPSGGAGFAFATEVSDRLGDYGTGAVVIMRPEGPVCHVETFSLSCPVLGRGVEDAVLDQIVARAADAGCGEVTFDFVSTGRNAVAAEFLRGTANVVRAAPSGQQVRIRVCEVERQS